MSNSALVESHIFDRVSVAVAVGTTAINSDSVRMKDGDSVLFIVLWGTITDGAPVLKGQQSSDDGVADAFTDLKGTSVAVALTADDGMTILDIRRPLEEYVRCVADRSLGSPVTGAVIDAILAIVYDTNQLPVTQPADVDASEKHVAPAEGTA